MKGNGAKPLQPHQPIPGSEQPLPEPIPGFAVFAVARAVSHNAVVLSLLIVMVGLCTYFVARGLGQIAAAIETHPPARVIGDIIEIPGVAP